MNSSLPPIHPSLEEFQQRAASGANLIPVWCELVADGETPVSVYKKIGSEEPSFLFESVEQNENMGRFSFAGTGALCTIVAKEHGVTIRYADGRCEERQVADPLKEVEATMAQFRFDDAGQFPRFCGGAVGYLGYDAVRWFEPAIPPPPPDSLGVPDLFFLLTETVVIFDHLRRRMQIVINAHIRDHETPDSAYQRALAQVRSALSRLAQPVAFPFMFSDFSPEVEKARSNTTREEYHAMIARGKEYIHAGDIFQFVAAQRFETDFTGDPLDLYRALRFVNPSPYMFCIRCEGGYSLVGSSPEVHVRLTGELVEIRPIAGTRRRGADEEEDAAHAKELLADEKERAEHLMLVDLARNDIGRIAEFGSVRITDFMTIERYSHVMHIVTHVSAQLAPGRNAFDVLRATFPAGTVSGAPKVRAMQIINTLEKSKRCTYAGAVGYFGWNGNLDSCIALRTVLLKDGKAYVQAGGGVVADSSAEGEYQESINKSMAALRAIERARALNL